MPAFFDPALVEKWGVGFISEGKIDESLRKLIPGAFITRGQFKYPSQSELRDLAWNHMDQNHRPYIHRTYGEAMRVFVQQQSAFSLTRFGRWPAVIPVFDGYFKENGFYQFVVVFGLFVIVNIMENKVVANGTEIDISWLIASHRWLRFAHPILNRRLTRVNEIQNREDDPVRDRRVTLRVQGFRFLTDEPDFVNSNVVENNAIFPSPRNGASIALSDLPNGRAIRVVLDNRAYVFRRKDQGVEVWPGICVHEGAEIDASHLNNDVVKCPWHGLEFGARSLSRDGQTAVVCGAQLELAGNRIVLGAAPARPSGKG
ncbi:MAG TPA: Rieske (2Fe-2S) protein [Stellaceae bacterium]|nr:Rieske (2Fe-2S) protein [Stellaceae bacterium]